MTRCLALLALVVLLAGCGGGSEPFTVHGAVDVAGGVPDQNRRGAFCDVSGDYPDLEPGAQVVVKDNDGKAVGTGYLQPGRMTAADGMCRMRFTVKRVPGGDDLYAVSVTSRGDVTFKRTEASAVRLTLG